MNHHCRERLSQLSVLSAGTHALIGHAPTEEAQQAMREFDIDIAGLRAMQCDYNALSDSDLILVMQDVHRQWIFDANPSSRGKVFLMGKWKKEIEVDDPYGRDIHYYRRTRDQLDELCELWCDWIHKVMRQ